jgi:ATP-dependent Clp protease ATP-binding subunit ClpX
MSGADLEFAPDALEAIARKAMTEGTGARSLRGILEKTLLELQFGLGDAENRGRKYTVTADMILGKPKLTVSPPPADTRLKAA